MDAGSHARGPARGGGPDHPVVVDPASSVFLEVPAGFSFVEREGTRPGVTYPLGFLAAGVPAGLKESGRPDVGVVSVPPEYRTDTVSAPRCSPETPSPPPRSIVSRRETTLASLAAVVMNSGYANACTGVAGLAAARAMQQACARMLWHLQSGRVGVASTGPIGRPLDTARTLAGIEAAVEALSLPTVAPASLKLS